MTVEVVPFRKEHLGSIRAQDPIHAIIPDQTLEMLQVNPWSRTIILDEKPMACGGIIELWSGRGELWAFLDHECRGNGTFVDCFIRTAREVITGCPLRRIEAAIRCDFAGGHRMARALGLNLEAECLRAYGPDGADYAMYAVVK